MGIKTIFIDGMNCPFFVCDICGETIEARIGAAVFDMLLKKAFVDVLHVHKGKCLNIAEQRMGKPRLGWDELSVHIAHLTHNAKRKKRL